jgi:hypothetical protein
MLYLIRDYERLCALQTVEQENEKLSKIKEKISAIEAAEQEIPEEYRIYAVEHLKHKTPLPPIADIKTWSKYKSRFLFRLAKELGEI